MARRPRSSGRKRLPIEMIQDQGARSTTFCKRRLGIFKKANEISTLCGTQTAFLIFYEAGNTFSFGSPSISFVLNNYQNQVNGQCPQVIQPIQGGNNNPDRIFEAFNQALREKDDETKRGNELKERLQTTHDWLGKPVNELNIEQLAELNEKIQNLKLIIE